MEKGKLGIRMSFYAVAAFVLAALGYSTGWFLLAGVVLVVEKDEWASRQVIQSGCLMVLSSIISVIFDVFGFIDWTSWASYDSILYKIFKIWSHFQDIVFWGVGIVVYIFAFLAIMKVAKGKEAGVPLADKFANWAYGKVVEKVKPVAPVAPAQPAAPAQPVAQPVAPAQPVMAQPAAAPAANCTNCGAPLNGAAFCTKCGTPAAK